MVEYIFFTVVIIKINILFYNNTEKCSEKFEVPIPTIRCLAKYFIFIIFYIHISNILNTFLIL